MLSIIQNIFSKYKQYLSKYVSKKKKKDSMEREHKTDGRKK